MKILSKISVLLLGTLFVSSTVFSQNAPQSRLNIGKDPKKVILSSSSSEGYIFGTGKFPTKLNLSSKTEYTKFYRDLLLNSSSTAKTTETGEPKPVAFKPVSEYSLEKVKFGNIYPNPAVSFADVPYDVNDTFKEGKVSVMNMVGTSLLEYPLVASNSKVRINTSSLESGLYMVQFIVDGKKVSTKKLLVERN